MDVQRIFHFRDINWEEQATNSCKMNRGQNIYKNIFSRISTTIHLTRVYDWLIGLCGISIENFHPLKEKINLQTSLKRSIYRYEFLILLTVNWNPLWVHLKPNYHLRLRNDLLKIIQSGIKLFFEFWYSWNSTILSYLFVNWWEAKKTGTPKQFPKLSALLWFPWKSWTKNSTLTLPKLYQFGKVPINKNFCSMKTGPSDTLLLGE